MKALFFKNFPKKSNEIFISYQYYIEVLMTYEKVLVQSGINPSSGPIDVGMIPPNLQEEFLKARDFIEYVDKQIQ
ncbi:uncharacterized protein DUF3600 [Anoxybacillus vitaminiphilus]|uniref:Uncharacterized protein DUF3600 n=2 Tax=Paranoxybacillus vitaminiphilus TaxID=581036 RepID=A0A327YQ50_9BACL|nr:uncharacterized protein DUF3600 [Anoxybacillus vitaminiphilus]